MLLPATSTRLTPDLLDSGSWLLPLVLLVLLVLLELLELLELLSNMPTSDLPARFEFASDLIKDAGQLALNYFHRLGTLTIKQKGEQDMASEADLNVEMLIRERLHGRFPEDAFLGEETGRTEFSPGPGVWVVDPIDGTQPFISGLSGWCISIAFVLDGDTEIGLVYGPAPQELFQGCRGRPAALNTHPF